MKITLNLIHTNGNNILVAISANDIKYLDEYDYHKATGKFYTADTLSEIETIDDWDSITADEYKAIIDDIDNNEIVATLAIDIN